MTPISIGIRRELFLDNFLIDTLQKAHLQLAHPERREVVFEADAPWEDGAFNVYSTVPQGKNVRLYYRASIPDLKEEKQAVFGHAESSDGGKSFTRTALGLHDFKGSKDNNIIWQGAACAFPAAFIDTNPACPAHARYKGLASEWEKLFAMRSADGIHWHLMRDETVSMPGTFDSINTAFWDGQARCYRSYTRYFNKAWMAPAPAKNSLGVRCIQMSTSQDFVNWTAPLPLQYEDGDEITQLYTNSIIPCPGAEHIYLGFPNRFVEERIKSPDQPWTGVNDALFMASRDGVRFTRYRDAWVRPGLDSRNWTSRNNYPSWNIIQTSPDEWSVLISEHYMQRDRVPVRLRRLAIRPWGFVSVHSGFDGGEMVTKPITFGGNHLHLNYSTSAAGAIQAEIQDEKGKTIPGYGLQDMAPLYGDELDTVIAWRNGSDLSSLAGKAIRLRFVLKDADLFALRFTDANQN